MKLTICRLDASFFLTERTVSWIMQSMTSFLDNVSKADLSLAKLGASTAYAYYARAAYDSSKNASNLSFDFDKKYIFKPDRDDVKGMENPNTLSSWCRLMGFLYDDDGVFKMGEFAENFIANNLINTKELCLVILSKQWVVVDGQCKRSLLGVIHELISNNEFLEDLSNYSSANNQENKNRSDRLQKAFFFQVCGRQATENDEIQFSRFDALRNTLLLAGILSSNMYGKVFVSNNGANILKDFFENESRLSTYNPEKVDNKEKDFHRYMSSIRCGIFEIMQDDNIDIYRSYTNLKEKRNYIFSDKGSSQQPLQQIFYGAPGTGKSDTIFEQTKDLPSENVYRTTFHPDSDYASFVGSYKPKMNDRTIYGAQGPLRNSRGEEISEPKITYTFSPQAFTNAYIRAWQTNEPVFLIIEEINRGNCAQIFGDLFQLLDRDEYGYSKYEIVADSDLADCIKEKLDNAGEKECLTSDIKEGKILKLPNNLYIWATMNTSDQSLFPIDSAFKRRWEWKYIKIKKGINKKTKQELDWKIKVGEENYDWWEFVNRINDKIAKMTSSADKQLGYFFCLADGNGDISADTFVNKVAFYLWNDVFKDYAEDGSPLLKYKKKEDDKGESDLTFPDFFDGRGEIDSNVVKQFVEKVMKEDEMDKPAE